MGKKDRRKDKAKKPEEDIRFEEGMAIIDSHPLFSRLYGSVRCGGFPKHGAAAVSSDGRIFVNKKAGLLPAQWAYVIAHCMLHLAFGHFDAKNMPGYEIVGTNGKKRWKTECDIRLWNIACDIYVAKFLADVKFAQSMAPQISEYYKGSLSDERAIYDSLERQAFSPDCHVFGTGAVSEMDMLGLDEPIVYKDGAVNEHARRFAYALAQSVTDAVNVAGGISAGGNRKPNRAEEAASWFVNHYPLLGGLASGFKVVYDYGSCSANEISVAAVDVESGEIYVNPAAGLGFEELKFVLAHEYLHAGLEHHARCQGRDRYLWNVACDYVINGWLRQMGVGTMPERGVLYDPAFEGASAEEVYDRIITRFREYAKEETLRGYGKGDVMAGGGHAFGRPDKGITLDAFCRSAIQNGLEYHRQRGRGLIPAGLEEEIRALSMPPVPWDVKLAEWFEIHFAPLAKKRTYARPSRRQGSTPDIPRPRTVAWDLPEHARTFGVVIDTSGSMSAKLIGHALGAVASYAAEREVPYARVVFCDADAYDAGYLAPEEVAGRVEVKGRGGTVLQPAVDLLAEAEDFPRAGPILIITDGEIEPGLSVPREHAFIIPSGSRLPFKARGEVFRMKELKEDEQ